MEGETQKDDDGTEVQKSVSFDSPKRKFSSVVRNVMIAKQVTQVRATAVLDQEDSQEIWPATAAWFLGPKVCT